MNKNLEFIGYENYVITDSGKVWSIKRKHWLKPRDDGFGYLQVALYKDGKTKNFRVHRLVALAFLPNPDGLSDINHLNEIKSDNRLENLEWTSHKDNCNYGTRNERISKKIYCVELNKVFKSVSQAANELGIKQPYISRCLTGKQKTTCGYHFEYYGGVSA